MCYFSLYSHYFSNNLSRFSRKSRYLSIVSLFLNTTRKYFPRLNMVSISILCLSYTYFMDFIWNYNLQWILFSRFFFSISRKFYEKQNIFQVWQLLTVALQSLNALSSKFVHCFVLKLLENLKTPASKYLRMKQLFCSFYIQLYSFRFLNTFTRIIRFCHLSFIKYIYNKERTKVYFS